MRAAEEISKNPNTKILLIEKNNVKQTDIAWSCWPEQLEKHGLAQVISNQGTKTVYYSTDGESIRMNANLSTAVEEKLLKILFERINKNNFSHFNNCELLSFDQQADKGIAAVTTKGVFKSKLLIDACGYDSPTAKKYRLQENKWQWQNLVYIVDNVKRNVDLDEFYFFDRRITTKNNPIFWMEPYSKNKIILGAYYLLKNPISMKVIENELDQYRRYMDIEGDVIKECKGIIPLYDNQPLAFDNIMLVGASGSMISPGTAFGLFSSLESGEFVAKYVHDALAANIFTQKYLKRYQKDWWRKNKIPYTFGQISLRDQISNHAPEDFKKHFAFTKKIVHNESNILERWQRDETTIADIKKFSELASDKFSIAHLKSRLSNEDFIKIIYYLFKLKFYINTNKV